MQSGGCQPSPGPSALCWCHPCACTGIKDASMCLHRRKQGSIITAVVAPRSVLSTANGPDTKLMDPHWRRALPFGDLHALPCPCSLCLCATSSVYPCSPEPCSVLSHPQLLPRSGDVEGGQAGAEGHRVVEISEGSEHSQNSWGALICLLGVGRCCAAAPAARHSPAAATHCPCGKSLQLCAGTG